MKTLSVLLLTLFFPYNSHKMDIRPFAKNVNAKHLGEYSFHVWSPGSGFFTGTFMKFENTYFFVTSRHCLFEEQYSQKLTNTEPLVAVTLINGIPKPVKVSIKPDNILNFPNVDLAMVIVPTPPAFVKFVEVDTAYNNDSLYSIGSVIKLVGYPHSKGTDPGTPPTIVTTAMDTPLVGNNNLPNMGFMFDTKSEPGASGAPVFGEHSVNGKRQTDFLGVYHGAGSNEDSTKGWAVNRWVIKRLLRDYHP